MLTFTFTKSRLPIFAVLALLTFLLTTISQAKPAPRFTGYHLSADNVLYGTLEAGDGQRDVVIEKNTVYKPQVLIVDGGYAIIYETQGMATGGYEGESRAVKRYDVNGVKTTVLDAPLKLFRLREAKGQSTRNVYVASMHDGGAGISNVYVFDRNGRQLWSRSAAGFAGTRNGKLVIALYPEGEDGVGAPSIGTVYLDIDKTLDGAYRYEN